MGTGDKCCPCYFQSKQEQAQEYSNYHQVYQQEVKKQEGKFQQLKLLKSYPGCPQCKSKAVDAYLLYEERKLVCSPCLEKEVQEAVEFFTSSLRECREKLKGCKCEKSPKVRVSYYDFANYGYTYCEKCERKIEGAGKHGTIKNRNDPKFWGLKAEEKVLCGNCLESKKDKMPPLRKAEFNRYRKTGRL